MRAIPLVFWVLTVLANVSFGAFDTDICRERGGSVQNERCVCKDGLEITSADYDPQICPGYDTFKAVDEMKEAQYKYSYIPFEDIHSKNGMSYERLKKHIVDSKINSIDSLMESFQKSAELEPLLHLYSLMKTSESAQPGKRILSHWGKLFLGISADPQNERHKQIEVVEFDLDEADFKFRVIDFNGEAPKFYDDAIAFREANPKDNSVAKCTQCHGKPARPLWDSYQYWPNAYEHFAPKSLYSEGRFRYLHTDTYHLNAATGKAFAVLNFKRIAKKVSEKREVFDKIKYALLGTLVPCHSVETFFTDSEIARMRTKAGKNLKELTEDTRRVNLEDYATRIARESEFRTPKRSSPEQDNNDIFWTQVLEVAEARFILEGNGISMHDWSLAGGPSGFSYGFRNNGENYDFSDLKYEILKLVEETDPDISEYRFSGSMWPDEPYTQRVCSILREKSLKATR